VKVLTAAAILLALPVLAQAESLTSKTASAYWQPITFPQTVPSTDTVVASAPLPEKYSSKKNMLLITTSVAEACAGDQISGTVTVGGVAAAPASATIECYQNEGFEMVTRTWEFPSEAQGGSPVADGSTVDLHLQSLGGTAARSQVNIHIVAVK
jgi:hypothetical protein